MNLHYQHSAAKVWILEFCTVAVGVREVTAAWWCTGEVQSGRTAVVLGRAGGVSFKHKFSGGRAERWDTHVAEFSFSWQRQTNILREQVAKWELRANRSANLITVNYKMNTLSHFYLSLLFRVCAVFSFKHLFQTKGFMRGSFSRGKDGRWFLDDCFQAFGMEFMKSEVAIF